MDDIVNGYGNSVLHIAAREGFTEAVKMLIAAGADVNLLNHKQSSPLHFFCYTAHDLAILKLLLQAGADPSAADEKGLTPLLVCCTSGRNDCITVLMEHGASAAVKDASGRSARDIAAFHQHKDIVHRCTPAAATTTATTTAKR